MRLSLSSPNRTSVAQDDEDHMLKKASKTVVRKRPAARAAATSSSSSTPAATPARSGRTSRDRWGAGLIDYGHCTVPSLLMQAQARLGLSPAEFNIVMQLSDMWWIAGDDPHPSKELLGKRMGMSSRQVQRHLTALEAKGLVKRTARYRGPKNQTSNGYDLSGLARALDAVLPEFRKVRDMKRLGKLKVAAKAT